MIWKKVNPVCLQSSCGMFTVAKFRTATGWVYQAFHLKQSLLVADNAEACKQACEVASEARP